MSYLRKHINEFINISILFVLGKSQYLNFGNSPYIQPNIWTEVGGIKKIPYGNYTIQKYYVSS